MSHDNHETDLKTFFGNTREIKETISRCKHLEKLLKTTEVNEKDYGNLILEGKKLLENLQNSVTSVTDTINNTISTWKKTKEVNEVDFTSNENAKDNCDSEDFKESSRVYNDREEININGHPNVSSSDENNVSGERDTTEFPNNIDKDDCKQTQTDLDNVVNVNLNTKDKVKELSNIKVEEGSNIGQIKIVDINKLLKPNVKPLVNSNCDNREIDSILIISDSEDEDFSKIFPEKLIKNKSNRKSKFGKQTSIIDISSESNDSSSEDQPIFQKKKTKSELSAEKLLKEESVIWPVIDEKFALSAYVPLVRLPVEKLKDICKLESEDASR